MKMKPVTILEHQRPCEKNTMLCLFLALYPTTGNVAQIEGESAWEFKGDEVQNPNGETFTDYNKNHLLKAHVSRPVHFKFQVKIILACVVLSVVENSNFLMYSYVHSTI